jgi:hypothetical protein
MKGGIGCKSIQSRSITVAKTVQRFSQNEYNRILDKHSAKSKGLGQTDCEDILTKHGASYEQAKNGAYVYIHHDGNPKGARRGNREEYAGLLNEFKANQKPPQDCIRYLKSLGFSYGQSKTAVHNYRCDKGLIRK